MTVLQSQINSPEMNQALARIAELEAKLAAASKANSGRLSIKVSEKGGVSVYGLGRFPVSLYRSQWERLLSHADQIKAFIEANASSLASKV